MLASPDLYFLTLRPKVMEPGSWISPGHQSDSGSLRTSVETERFGVNSCPRLGIPRSVCPLHWERMSSDIFLGSLKPNSLPSPPVRPARPGSPRHTERRAPRKTIFFGSLERFFQKILMILPTSNNFSPAFSRFWRPAWPRL